MAIIKAVNSKASIGKGINYITKEEKTEEKLISGINCNPETAIDEMKATKELYDKTNGRQYAHYIQSFNPDDNISPEKAHKLGMEWIERNNKFNGHEIVIATHKDKDHIHNHFIINSVNYETGLKLHTNKHEYQEMKDISNQISKEHGLIIPEKSKEQGEIISYNQNKYQAMKRHFEGNYKSYVIGTAIAVKKAKETAISKEDFIKKMENQGYGINWKDTSNHVTFINKETDKRVRLANLEKTFNDKSFTKEGLINEFERNIRARKGKRHTYRTAEERESGIQGINGKDKGTQRTDEKLHNSSYGQGHSKPTSNFERNSSNRGNEQKGPGTDDFDIKKATRHINRAIKENARNVEVISKPDARTREQEQREARDFEQRNSEQHTERVKPSKSRDWDYER